MRNLKRALSLTLASVMLLGMMVVGSSAAGYPDVSEEENIEAIEVLQAVGVMGGDENGNFNPDDYVTREQMAVIMAQLLKLDYNYYKGTNPFSDVPEWAAPYVAACAANGVTAGIGGGLYGSKQNIQAVQAALMMLKALGYFQYAGDYGDSYVLATVKQGTEIGLFNGIDSNADSYLTRNQVAQMVLNALQADMVRFTGDPGVEYTGTNGEKWVGGYKAEYTPRTSTDPKYNRLIDNKHSSNIDYSGQYYVQLGEELYNGDLIKRVDSDQFERPSYTWTYKTEKVGTYVDREKLEATYTTEVTGRDLYDLLNNITIRDYDLEIYVDGHEADNGTTDYTQYASDSSYKEEFTMADLKRSNTDGLGATGDGVLTEVFIDRDKEVVTVVSIHTWLAQATASYSQAKESASLKVYMKQTQSGSALELVSHSKTVSLDDVAEVAGVTSDTFYLVQMSDKETTKLEVVDIDEPQILTESTITKFSLDTKNSKGEQGLKYPTKLTADGVEYNDSDRAFYDVDVLDQYDQDLLTTNTYNVYLDKYGYFIGLDLHEGTRQYVFVTGYDMKNSNLSIQTASAAGIFLDGTMDSMTVNVKDTNKNIEEMVTKKADANATLYYQPWGVNTSDGVYLLNRWYTYTKNDAGVYTLKPCVDKDGKAMMLAAKSENADDADGPKSLKLNCSNLRLDGVAAAEGLLTGENMQYATTDLTSARAYGEDDSVFITVDVDEVSAKAGGDATNPLNITKAITEVNGVYSGVQDVDLFSAYDNRVVGQYLWDDGSTIKTAEKSTALNTPTGKNDGFWVGHDGKDNTALDDEGDPWSTGTEYAYIGENAYAVFDRNNFIIGAVIMGDAVGSNATKAYILDPVKYERYENGTYYWQFEAVIDGEIVTQEAESKFRDTIDTMRKNQYEIVELRYNSTGSVVTDVKELKRTDTYAGDLTKAADNIYGYPFDEIKTIGHKVLDKESVYDVVLTGNSGDATVTFKGVTRPRINAEEHTAAGKTFKTTAEGILKLQGRTMYVLNNQDDYGIDFVSQNTPAVVYQREGTENDWSWEKRRYATVQEAIDSLGDPNPATGEKEFRGIITAALNSNGVAEWIVFYSDTLAETKNNTDITSTMRVQINVRFGTTGESVFWDYYDVPKPATGDLAVVPTPDAIKGVTTILSGWKVVESSGIPTVWDKKAEGKVITFTYVESNGGSGSGTTTSTGEQEVRVRYTDDYSDPTNNQIGDFDYVTVPLRAGYGTLSKDLLKNIPDGYQLDPSVSNPGTDTDLGEEVEKQPVGTNLTLNVVVAPRTDIEKIEMTGATTADLKYGATVSSDAAADLKASGVKFKITFGTTQGKACSITVDADNTDFINGFANAASNGVGGTTASQNGSITVTAKGAAAKTVDVPCVIYASVAAGAFTAKSGSEVDGLTVTTNPTTISKVKVGDKITITFTQSAAANITFGSTRAVTVNGSNAIETLTANDWSVTDGVTGGGGTDPVVGKVSVTIQVKTIAANTFTAEVEVDT